MLRQTSIWIITGLMTVLLTAGCGSMPASQNTDSSLTSGAAPVDAPASKTSNVPDTQATMVITTYQATKDAMYLIPETHTVPKNDHPAQTALELFTAGTNNPDLVTIVPAGTKVLGIKVKNHIAYANFNNALVKSNPGGSTEEMLLVAAIVDTLTEFPNIERVQILVDGKKVDTITGHMDTSAPLGRSEYIIKNQAAR
ncbi:MAG TPA: GerMN domain-containing protein [Methylomusa anaerophila]|uniref:Spore germination protein GerM n=1 Tax=Methylomusa anaerophila TaxID=1930071 RepID=A0A348AIE4_9FIRM|nr:GerMN domain-containing protein [Methylomusa anaerophila]BBB90842.1 spore germination protein GerM [Methylomusa anaerophila]HML90636.1 GerMN domain-containing protein [Methylomusa anaerophila]